MTITAETIPTTESRARARAFLTAVIGSPPADLRWDEVHHLQGHAHVDEHELVVIAARDELHHPVVLLVADWAEIRRNAQNRRAVLAERAIADHVQLTAALAAGRAPGRTQFESEPAFEASLAA